MSSSIDIRHVAKRGQALHYNILLQAPWDLIMQPSAEESRLQCYKARPDPISLIVKIGCEENAYNI